MSFHQEDLTIDSEPDPTGTDNGDLKPTSPLGNQTVIIRVSSGGNVNLQVGNNNLQHHNLSKSVENLPAYCENCGSTGTSPTATINRSFSTEFLDAARDRLSPFQDCCSDEQQPLGKVDNLIRKFNNQGSSSPIVFQKRLPNHQTSNESEISNSSIASEPSFVNSIPGSIGRDPYPVMDSWGRQRDLFEDSAGQYSWRESDNSSSCSSFAESDLTVDSSEVDSVSLICQSPVLPKRHKKCAEKSKSKPLVDDDEYMSMDGSCAGSLVSFHVDSLPREPKIKDQGRKTSGKIPAHKLEEAQATLGFRSDVNGELKRVRRILRPHKSKDGYYVLWQFSEYVISLSVTFLQDIKNFAICYDRASQTWLILKDGPRSSSLSTLMQLYIRKRIKLPLGKGQSNGRSSVSPSGQNHDTIPRASSRKTSMAYPPNSTPPPLPPRRASAPVLCPTGKQPSLPPRPQGFLTLSKPVIQPLDESHVTTRL